MTTTTRNGRWPHRLGRAAGHAWRGYLRGEQCAVGWLLQRGVPRHVARVLPWIFKVAVFAVLLYAAFWPALLLAFLVAVAHGDWNAEPETPEPEWRDGPVGFGLYTYDGHRIDPHDFIDETKR